jgi:fibronectin-binding autotransporter adhesin
MRLTRRGVAALSVMGLAIGMVANPANAATSIYFDINAATTGSGVASGGSYSWESSFWSLNSAGTAATGAFAEGDFTRFAAGTDAAAKNYTITASSNHTVGGMFLQTNGGGTVTLNGPGVLSIDPTGGPQGFLVSTSAQSLKINAVLGGTGGVAPESSGTLDLFGSNTYSGGTLFGVSGSPLISFNNNNSFGTGTNTLSGVAGNFAALLSTGGSTITLPNNWTSTVSGNGVNFASAANTPVISTGNWNMGANNLLLRNNGNNTAPLTISGVISGTTNLTLSANNSGTITFKGANTYTGTTTVGVGTTPVTLILGASNTIATSSEVIMAGGILNPDAINQIMSTTTLGMTVSSTIDFVAGASEMDFANSSALAWTGTLNLANWDFSLDKLRFDAGPTGLTSTQLGKIEFNGSAATLGTAQLDANGFVFVPEPTTMSVLALGAFAGLGRRRRNR